jgi:elongin-A
MKVQNPDQLEEIENNSPQIRGEDAELWKAFIKRDINGWQEMGWVPKNPESWSKVYRKYQRWDQKRIEEGKAKLLAAMTAIKQEKAKHVTRKVDPKNLPRVPRDPWMRSNDGGVPLSRNYGTSSASKPKVATSLFDKAVREAKETSRNRLIAPSHKFTINNNRVRQAPAAMIDEYRREKQSPVKMYAPAKPIGTTQGGLIRTINKSALEERERRLLAIKASTTTAPNVNVLSDDEVSDDLDDLFDATADISTPSSVSPTPPASRLTATRLEEIQRRPSPVGARPLQPTSAPRGNPLATKPSQSGISSVFGKKNSPSLSVTTIKSLPAQKPSNTSSASKAITPIQKPTTAAQKPSDRISAIISEPKMTVISAERVIAKPVAPSSKLASMGPASPPSAPVSAPASPPKNTSPTRSPPRAFPPRPIIKKRKAEVDIFNRNGRAVKR